MKGGLAAAAVAALTGGVAAALHGNGNGNGHGHGRLFAKRANETAEVCVPGCTTIWTTITGEATLVPNTAMTTTTTTSTTVITVMTAPANTQAAASVAPVAVPTPQAQLCPTPGVYTFPATTMTLSKATTVAVPATTQVPAGPHVLGGVTTAVEAPGTITVPVATVVTSGSVTTSTIVQTEYVCPSAGNFTIAPITTSVGSETVVTYPVVTSYSPGTYVAQRQVVTATDTSFVYYCPFTSAGLPTSSPSPAPQPTTVAQPPPASVPETPAGPPAQKEEVPSAPTSVAVPVPVKEVVPPSAPAVETVPMPTKEVVPSVPAKEVVPSAPAKEVVPSAPAKEVVPSAPAKEQGPPPTVNSKLVSDNDHFGITYTPYESSNGHCKSAEQVDKDMAELKRAGFSTVRVYSTDCETLEKMGSACEKHGLSIIVGIFVKNTGCSYESADIKEQVDKLSRWDKWNLVKLVVVGNEAIMNGYCSPTELRSLVGTVRHKCSQYKGPYTISETLNVWQRHNVSSAICDVVDVTGANIHPYFNDKVAPKEAGKFVAGQLDLLGRICPNHHEVINLECGWPTRGNCNGVACPGKQQQADAIKSIREATGGKTIFFSYQDDKWKNEGACGCEQSWGTADSFFHLSIGVSV